MPAASIVLSIFGLTATTVPLGLVLPQASPGCTLHAATDSITAGFPIAGNFQSQLPIPNNPALIAFSLTHQYVALELGAGGAIVDVTASNAVQVSIGAF